MKNFECVYTDSMHPGFKKLSAELENELRLRDGDMAERNYELNKIGFLPHVILLFIDTIPVACGGFGELGRDTIELKRMYVQPSYRRKNLASIILAEIESLAKSLYYEFVLLETGKNQPEAISFYQKHGYSSIEKFGKYIHSTNSLCFGKQL